MGRLIIPFAAAAYTASKYTLEGLSESNRHELSGTGVDVTIIEPGGFGTNFAANMDSGADTDRLESYGPLAEMPAKFWGPAIEQLTAEDAPNPPQVADAVLNLIRTPAGQRPLRIVVDSMGGDAPGAINSTTDQIQSQMFEQMEIKDLLSVKL